jgi:hypothetical protein
MPSAVKISVILLNVAAPFEGLVFIYVSTNFSKFMKLLVINFSPISRLIESGKEDVH